MMDLPRPSKPSTAPIAVSARSRVLVRTDRFARHLSRKVDHHLGVHPEGVVVPQGEGDRFEDAADAERDRRVVFHELADVPPDG
jgi:hypothetical protein